MRILTSKRNVDNLNKMNENVAKNGIMNKTNGRSRRIYE